VRSSRQTSQGTVATLRVVAALSLLAAAVHLWVMPEHLEEWWGYGAFFLVLAVAQGMYGLGLLRWPSRPFLLLGVAGNLAIVILWLVTRTTGIPLLGPHAGEVEEVGALDLICTLAEVCVVFGLGALAMKDLVTESRIQVVVVVGVSALLFWHLLHLLAGSSAH
jgi:manganese oxidase